MDIDVRDPKFIRWAVAILLVVVAVPLDFTSTLYPFTYAARQESVAKLEARHQELSRDLEKARLLVSNLARVEREYQILHEQWKVAQTLLPEENEMPNLLRKVTAAGQQSGVEFDLFRPIDPISRGFYTDNPVDVRVVGGFHQTGVFLSRLANLNRIVNVTDLQFRGVANQDGSPATVETSLKLTAYTLGGGPVSPEPGQTRQLAASGGSGAGGTNTQAVAKAKTARAGH
jgi:type IV pilus assembly protein PilO